MRFPTQVFSYRRPVRPAPALLLTLLLAGPAPAPVFAEAVPAAEPCAAATSGGWLAGRRSGEVCAFLGIPYAEPPLGELRWRAPQPAPLWSGVRLAQQLPPDCPQTRDGVSVLGQEDCLYLNVWTKAPNPGAGLPVLVFIHGGGNVQGSSAERISQVIAVDRGPPLYAGNRLAWRGDLVVVTLNYRLAALGFFADPSLATESNSESTGNFGLMDQLAALRWIQDEIGAFGGDPQRVTIAGQSGGALDVCTLLASPEAAGLFQGAVMMSGLCGLKTPAEITGASTLLVSELGCDTAQDVPACMRALDAGALVLADAAQATGQTEFPFNPSIDGFLALDQPEAVFATGAHNRVPFVVGSTAGEVADLFRNVSPAGYVGLLANLVSGEPAALIALLQLYPLSGFPSPTEAVVAAYSDATFTCATRRLARLVAGAQAEPVFRYHFRRVLSAQERKADAAYHSSDLLYLFQHMGGVFFEADEDDRAVEAHMAGYWSRFADSGNPNGDGKPVWPVFDPVVDDYLILDVEPAAGAGLFPARCDFWDGRKRGPGGT